jgi:hypothetical protein
MKASGGVNVLLHIFFISALDEGDWLASRPGRFTSGERAAGTHYIEGCLGPRTGLDDVERRKILPLARKSEIFEWLLVIGMDQTRVSKRLFLSKTDGKRNMGRPRLISLEDVENDIRELKITT